MAKECVACKQEMEVGFIPEASVGGFFVSVWHPGEPDTKKKGLKEKLASPAGVRFENDKVLALEAWRCSDCGRVDFFAHRPPVKGELG